MKIDLRLDLSHIFIDMRLILSYIRNIAILQLSYGPLVLWVKNI
jgi:hypothetical protein